LRAAADGLGDDQVDVAGQRRADHSVEAVAVLGAGAGDALVGEDAGEFPVLVILNVLGIMPHLVLVTGQLFVIVSGYTGIGSDAPLPDRQLRGVGPLPGSLGICLDDPALVVAHPARLLSLALARFSGVHAADRLGSCQRNSSAWPSLNINFNIRSSQTKT